MNVLAFLAIAAHMCSAYQVFAQPVSAMLQPEGRLLAPCSVAACGAAWQHHVPADLSSRLTPRHPCPLAPLIPQIFDTIESHVKAWRIRKQQQAALALGGAPTGAPLAAAASHSKSAGRCVSMQPSPFDAIAEEGSGVDSPDATGGLATLPSGTTAKHDCVDEKAAAVAEAGYIATSHSAGAALDDGPLGGRRMSVRLSAGGLAVRNSCPVPDLVPPSGACGWSILDGSVSLAVWCSMVFQHLSGCIKCAAVQQVRKGASCRV